MLDRFAHSAPKGAELILKLWCYKHFAPTERRIICPSGLGSLWYR